MWTFFACFDALCLWCNYVWVQGVAGSFKRLSGAIALSVSFGRDWGKKWEVLGFFVKKPGFVGKHGGGLVRGGGFLGKKIGGGV